MGQDVPECVRILLRHCDKEIGMLLCKDYLLQVPITKLDIVSRGWDGISFTSVATASATQRYKDISLPLPLLQR